MGGDNEESGGGGDDSDSGHGPARTVSEVGEGAGKLAEGIAQLIPEEEAGTAHDVREGFETGSKVAKTAADGAKAVDKLGKGIGSGDFSDIGSGVGSATDAARHIVPDSEVDEVLGGVGQVARGVGQLVDGARELFDSLDGESSNVRYHVEVEGTDATWQVRSVHYLDGIGGLPTCTVMAAVERDHFLEETELFGKDVHLTIERGDQQRSFKGIVCRSDVRHGRDEQLVDLEITPALWMLSQTVESRIYQNVSVPQLIKQLFTEYLEAEQRLVRIDELTEQYPDHEYLVQHRESHFQFISRLCAEEGIWFYFDHESEDHEAMVLADSNDNRPRIEGGDDGRIEYSDQAQSGPDHATSFRRHRSIGATDAVFSGFDWTNPSLAVRHDVVERGEWRGPRLEVHEHAHGVRHHEYDDGGGQYRANTAERQARMHTERLDLSRARWSVDTNVIDARPGHVFELAGAGEHDGTYLIVNVNATGHPGSETGGFSSTLELVPADVPYRPQASARPRMLGPETAIVVGDDGEEIHTDRHGRVKVQFHWDRRGERDGRSSAWIRVAQGWAGAGWGTIFIPRIGMEVLVSFLGGDPDRPIITGCLYNGANPVPYELPEHKTRSTIKTNSSVGGGGYNELRFEDKKGSEEIFIHAEKDFNEVVENCHTTHVKVDQTNTVDHDQTETIGNDQTLHVKNNRAKTVDVDEDNKIIGNRITEVGPDGGDDTLKVQNNRFAQIEEGNDGLWILRGDRATVVTQGKYDITTKGRFQIKQNHSTHFELRNMAYLSTPGRLQLKSGESGSGVHYDAKPSGDLKIKNTAKLVIESDGDQLIKSTGGKIKLTAPQRITLSSNAEIVLECGGSKIKLTPSGIEISGPEIKINATSGITDITAKSQVKIKC